MLTPDFYARYRVLPRRWTYEAARAVFTTNVALASTRFRVEGDPGPSTPVLFATAADGHHEVQLCEAILKSSRSEGWVKV